jgi:hypothetical protein
VKTSLSEQLSLSMRAGNFLEQELGITSLDQLTSFTQEQFLGLCYERDSKNGRRYGSEIVMAVAAHTESAFKA